MRSYRYSNGYWSNLHQTRCEKDFKEVTKWQINRYINYRPGSCCCWPSQLRSIAVAATFLAYSLGSLWQSRDSSAVTFAETAPSGISDPSAVTDEQNNIEVYRTIAPGVAFINSTSYAQDWWGDVQEGKGTGSGSVIDSSGHILTNYHVIENAQKLTVTFGGGKVYPATVVGGDPDTDLAVIKIDPPAGLPIVPMGDSDNLTVGQKVLAIGNPFGLDRTLTTGVISGLQRPIRARNDRPIDAAIQTDASINPGNSGGPLLDKFGRMIGINSQILSPSGGGSVGVGFAVPVNTAKRVIPQILQFGSVRRPKLGIDGVGIEQLQKRNIQLPVDKGLLLYSVSPDGPAFAAGLRGLSRSSDSEVVIGDVITAIDGQSIGDLDDLYRYLDKKQIGDTVQVQVFRNGKSQTLPVKLAASAQPQGGRRVQ